MPLLNRISVRTERVVPPIAGRSVAPGVLAILYEVKTALERYAATRESTVIDLRWLAAMPANLEQLRFALGDGEVSAIVYSQGITHVNETGIPCVWWISHRDHEAGTHTEMLEIVRAPLMLCGNTHDIEGAIGELRARLAALGGNGAHGFEHSPRRGEQ